MNFTAISGVSGSTSMQGVDPTMRRQQMDQVLGAVADKLGMSKSDLQAALKSGQSLADVAQSKGMSLDDLKSTITSALKAAGSTQTDDQLAQLADKIANHHRGGHHHAHAAPSSSDSSTAPVQINLTLLQMTINGTGATTSASGTSGANVDARG